MAKRPYHAPAVTRVRLVVKHAILSVCNTSNNLTPLEGDIACSIDTGCLNPG